MGGGGKFRACRRGAGYALFPFCAMKICDATQFYSEVGGGVRRYIQEKRRHILEQTEDEHILLVPGERTEVVREGRLTTCTVASPRVNRTSRYRILFQLAEAERMLCELRPDIIESGDPYQLGWRMIETGRELQIPVVGFYHSHFPEAYLRTVLKYCGPWLRDAVMAYAQDYIVRLYNDFDATLVPSVYLGGLLEGWGVERVHPVRLGVDVAVFRPEPGEAAEREAVREKLGLARGRTLLLYVGRLAGEKNTPVLLQALRKLDREHPGRFAFLIVGDGAMRGRVEAALKDVESMRWISFCHDSGRLAQLYRLADVFVHPGVCETFGLVALEAQACGCPVAGIRGSYMDANIMAGLELWAEENTPKALAEAVVRMVEAGPRQIGEQAGTEGRRSYAWPVVFGRIFDIYSRAMVESSSRARHGGMYSDVGGGI